MALNLRGLFYKKLVEREKLVEELPGFKIERPKRIVEFPPKIEDITKVNIMCPLIEPFAYAHIKWNPEIKELMYSLIEPELTEKEKKILEKISDALIELVEVGLTTIKGTGKAAGYLEEQVLKIIKDFGLKLTPNQYMKIMYYIYRNFVGYNEMEALMQDPNIEDINCDGINTPIFIVHRKFGSIRTNIAFTDIEKLREFIVKLAERSGRYVSYAEPILNGTLPDGSLDYDEYIIYRENGTIRCRKIGDVVDRFYNNEISNLPVDVSGIEVPSFNLNTLQIEWKPVNYVYRHLCNESLYCLTLETGRSVTLTGAHSIFVLRKNGIVAEKTSELKPGDYVVIPLKIPPYESIKEINLVKELSKIEFAKQLFLSNIPAHIYFDKREEILTYLKTHYKYFKATFENMKRKHLLPLELSWLLTEGEIKEVKIEEKYHPHIKIPSTLLVSEELMRLLGYYVAEGWTSCTKHAYQVVLSLNSNELDIIQDIRSCAKKSFGIDVSTDKSKENEIKVKITSRAVYVIFNEILKVSHGAKNKEIPDIVFNVNEKLRREFLKAWWTGDYGVTVSKKLISDVLYLTLLDGRVSSFSHRKRKGVIENRPIVSEEYYTQRLLTKTINYPYTIPISIFNPLNKTHMRFSNERIGRERLQRLIDDLRYQRFKNLHKPPKKFLNEWKKRGFLEHNNGNYELSQKGKEVIEEIDVIRKIIKGSLGFVRIKKIERKEKTSPFVYDVSVEGLENFVGGMGGVFCHNSRVSATIAEDIATRGATFTIRKFGEKPFSPIEQVDLNTASLEILAYYWYLVEHGANMLIVGGTATGKTSLMNSVCMFIPPEAKIVSIEDTRELRIPHEHWISGLARVGFGIPMPTGEKYGEVSMFDLLKESFRKNPDYVIVGETRGVEAYVMFQGMASGHTSISTFHAGSLDAVLKRLTSPPINLSPTLIESLNVVTILVHARERAKAARRIKDIVEIISVDPKTEEVKTNLVYTWNVAKDTYEKVNDSIIVRKLAEARGGTMEDAIKEIDRRRKVLEWMYNQNIKDYLEVTRYINMYYKEPEKLFELMKEKIELPVKPRAEVIEKPARRTSILELLGFKFIREK